MALLLVGQGVVAVGQVAGRLSQRWSPRRSQWAATAVLSAVLALLFIAPLLTYYRANRAADRMEQTLVVVERHARPGDLIVVSPRMFVRPLEVAGAKALYLTDHLTAAELDSLARKQQRMWILFSSFLPAPELQEALDRWVQAQGDALVRMPIKAPSALAYGSLTAVDAEARLKDRIVVLEDLVEGPAGAHGRWVRYGILADTYQALGDLYADRGESARAEEYWDKAEETRAAAPPPW
jgi:hypothetical protein